MNLKSTSTVPVTIPRKQQILALLKQSAVWISGEVISANLGISRAAVAKHVSTLRADGHAIASAPRRGYLLQARQDDIDLELIKKELNSTLIGQANWHVFAELPSSNIEAVLKAAAGAKEGTIVIVEKQTEGRGRKKQDWFSAPRSVQFSVILRPALAENKLQLLTSLATLALAEAVSEITQLQPQIKAPNDVLINGKKIAGVLLELGYRAGTLDWAVLGVGCNVNTLGAEFPPAICPLVTSLLQEGGVVVNRSLLLVKILQRLDYWYKQLNAGACADLEQSLKAFSQ